MSLINKKNAIKLTNKIFPTKKILSIHEIHNGYTNKSFLIKLNDGTKWQVRFPHTNKLINRKNEYDILNLTKNYNFIYFDKTSGIAIKKWIDGKNPNKLLFKNNFALNQLFLTIKKIHLININHKKHHFQKINFLKNVNLLNKLEKKYKDMYISIIKCHANDDVVVNHSDINFANLIITPNKKIHLIDFEWVCLASDYWDYANFIRESKINFSKINWNKYIRNFNVDILIQYIYLSSVYAYIWTHMMPQTKKIISYRKKTIKQIKYYFKYLKPCHNNYLLIDNGNTNIKIALVSDKKIKNIKFVSKNANISRILKCFKLHNISNIYIMCSNYINKIIAEIKHIFANANITVLKSSDIRKHLDLSNINNNVVIGNDILLLFYWACSNNNSKMICSLGSVYFILIIKNKKIINTLFIPSIIKGLNNIPTITNIPKSLIPNIISNKLVGLNTNDAFISGCNVLIKNYINYFLKKYKIKKHNCILTGLDTNKFLSLANYKTNKNLVLTSMNNFIKNSK